MSNARPTLDTLLSMSKTPPEPEIPRQIPSSRVIPVVPKLTPKQEKFVHEVAKDGNASRAARDAGYSEKSARLIGPENMQKPAVQQAVQILRKSHAEEAGITAVAMLRLALGIASVDPVNLLDEDGHPLPLQSVPPEVRKAIQGVDIVPHRYDEDGNVLGYAYRYKLADKNQALEKLFKHLGLYAADNAQTSGSIRALMEAVTGAGNRLPIRP